MKVNNKQLGFILILTAILLGIMVLIVIYSPYKAINTNLIKCAEDCYNKFTPSLIFSIILTVFILIYGIYLLIRKT